MSTRAVIARSPDGGRTWRGRYHHFDGYPSGLGHTLFALRNGFFRQDTEAMLKVLLDDHPAGWSTINGADFSLAPGFRSDRSRDKIPPQCYCHGDRTEPEQLLTEADASEAGAEYAYIFTDDRTMHVLSSYSNGRKMIGMFGVGDPQANWILSATIDLNGPEPDWNTGQE